jgi:ketosteroid isomerase-like protein
MMKKITIILVASIITINIYAQDKKQSSVAKAVENLKAAMISGDRSALENIAADQLSYGHSSGAVDNKTVFVEKIASGQSDFVTIDLSEQTISVSKKTAIVRHVLKAKTNDGGKPGEVNLRVLLIWQKQGGGWKLLARQAVRI